MLVKGVERVELMEGLCLCVHLVYDIPKARNNHDDRCPDGRWRDAPTHHRTQYRPLRRKSPNLVDIFALLIQTSFSPLREGRGLIRYIEVVRL